MNEQPVRVVVDKDGLGVPGDRAIREYGIIPDIIFKRHDGWTLGAPLQFEDIAYRMWANEWESFSRVPGDTWLPISEYHKGVK